MTTERPPSGYTSLADIDLEIRRVEEEVSETRLLHENLYVVYNLARTVLQRMNNNAYNRTQQSNSPTNLTHPTFSSNYPSSTANSRNTGWGDTCTYSPNFRPSSSYRQAGQEYTTSSGSEYATGTADTFSDLTGETIAEFVAVANFSALSQGDNCLSSSHAATSPSGSPEYVPGYHRYYQQNPRFHQNQNYEHSDRNKTF